MRLSDLTVWSAPDRCPTGVWLVLFQDFYLASGSSQTDHPIVPDLYRPVHITTLINLRHCSHVCSTELELKTLLAHICEREMVVSWQDHTNSQCSRDCNGSCNINMYLVSQQQADSRLLAGITDTNWWKWARQGIQCLDIAVREDSESGKAVEQAKLEFHWLWT